MKKVVGIITAATGILGCFFAYKSYKRWGETLDNSLTGGATIDPVIDDKTIEEQATNDSDQATDEPNQPETTEE